MNMDCVVVGVDGSPDAEAALRWAADFAVAAGAQLIGVHARGLLDHEGTGDIGARESWHRVTTGLGLAGDLLVRDGDPTSVLLAAEEAENADLVVVGRRGLGATIAGLGSTSQQVVQEATCPVVVIPVER